MRCAEKLVRLTSVITIGLRWPLDPCTELHPAYPSLPAEDLWNVCYTKRGISFRRRLLILTTLLLCHCPLESWSTQRGVVHNV
jgi:hypothetical protein